MCESVCQLYRMAGCLEDEEDHGVSEHRITPLRCQPSKGYKPPFSQFPHQFLLSRSIREKFDRPFDLTHIRLSINNRIARANSFPSAEEASLLSLARRLSRLVVVHKADTFLQGSLNTCARRGYICRYPRPSLGRLSTPEHSPLEKVGRGGGYLGVLSVISLALLLPALSLPTHPSLPEP